MCFQLSHMFASIDAIWTRRESSRRRVIKIYHRPELEIVFYFAVDGEKLHLSLVIRRTASRAINHKWKFCSTRDCCWWQHRFQINRASPEIVSPFYSYKLWTHFLSCSIHTPILAFHAEEHNNIVQFIPFGILIRNPFIITKKNAAITASFENGKSINFYLRWLRIASFE